MLHHNILKCTTELFLHYDPASCFYKLSLIDDMAVIMIFNKITNFQVLYEYPHSRTNRVENNIHEAIAEYVSAATHMGCQARI